MTHPSLTIGQLAVLLGTGGTYSTLAGLAGFDCGTAFRRHCLRRGLRRQMRNGVVIVIAEPTTQRTEGA